MLKFCYNKNFNLIHTATPGPVGLAALIIARILKLPIVSTYHTALPQYTANLTDDPELEKVMWEHYSQTGFSQVLD